MAYTFFVIFSLLIAHILCGVIDSTDTLTNTEKYRLDDSVIPSHYEISLTPYLHEDHPEDIRFTFDGTTDISIFASHENIKKIVLHSSGLNITKTELMKEADIENKIPVELSFSDIDNEKITITFEEPLELNTNYILKFVFSGKMQTEMRGFYTETYHGKNRNKIHFAMTQFEPTYARRAFPCFDEPKFKAVFVLKINRENKYVSQSNSKISSTVPVEGVERSVDTFKPTPVMSSYLLAFVISDFKSRESEHGNFTIWVREDALHTSNTAFEFGPKAVQVLDDYTGIPYSSMIGVEKLDFAAFPSFEAAGMENWGLVTYRESYMLCGSDNADHPTNQRVRWTVAHEVAHMWFGNLVTCDWWSATWLNEGLASYFQYYVIDQLVDNFDLDTEIVKDYTEPAFYTEASIFEESYPLTRPVDTFDEIKERFGVTSYGKGSLILRMFSYMMGQDAFKTAIRNYLQENAYKTATADDLFNALNAQWTNEAVDFKEIFSDWTTQVGYPIVSIHLNEDGRSIKVSQTSMGGTGSQKWIIPFTFTTNVELDFNNTTPVLYLGKDGEQVIELDHQADWIVANIKQSGYYRVNYDIRNWEKLTRVIRAMNGTLPQMHESQLDDDSFALYVKDQLDYDVWYNIFKARSGYTDDYEDESEEGTVIEIETVSVPPAPEVPVEEPVDIENPEIVAATEESIPPHPKLTKKLRKLLGKRLRQILKLAKNKFDKDSLQERINKIKASRESKT